MHIQALRAATLVSTMLATALVQAQAAARFDLPSQALGDSLRAVSMQTNTNLFFDPALVDGKQAKALKVQSTIDEALARLLAGTGIKYEFLDEKTIVLSAEKSKDGDVAFGTEPDAASGASLNGFWNRSLLAQSASSSSTYASNEEANAAQPAKEGGEEAERLEEIVVTAQKRKENLQNVPISISVLGGDALDESTFSGVTDALQSVPGFANLPQFSSGSSSFSIRGISSGVSALANGAGPVAYYVDGVPFGFVRNGFYPTDPSSYDLQRIEVLNGPQGTLYGANALSGVIRVLTNRANTENFSFKARGTGSDTTDGGRNYSGDLAVNVPIIEGRLGARAVVGFRDDSGWIDAPYGNDVNNSEARSYRLRLTALPTDSLSIDLSVWRSELESGAPPLSNDQRRITSLIPQPAEDEFTTYGLELAQEFSGFSLTSMTSYIDYHSHIVPNGVVAGFGILLDNTFDSTVLSEEINLVSSSEGAWRWSAGAFYRSAQDDKYQLVRSPAGAVLVLNDDFTDESDSYAVYGEIAYDLSKQWEFALGLRYFHDDQSMHINQAYPAVASVPVGVDFDATSKAWTPRAVLTWTPSKDHSLYTSYSQGFRSGFSQQPRVQHAAPSFEPVDPDKLTNYEIGAKGSILDGGLTYEAAVFYVDWQDVQRSLSILLPPNFNVTTTAVVNGAGASGAGASLALTARPVGGLELGGTASWNDLTLDNDVISGTTVIGRAGNRLSFSPEYTASVFAEYSWELGGGFTARVAGGGNYLPAMLADPTVIGGVVVVPKNDSMLTADARFSLAAAEHWTATLFADNLTDEDGTPARGLNPVEWSIRIRPRTIGLQLEYQFGK